MQSIQVENSYINNKIEKVNKKEKDYIKTAITNDKKIKMIVIILFISLSLILSALVFGKFTNLKNKTKQLKNLNDEVYVLNFKRDAISKKLSDSLDLEEIKKYAYEELNMRNSTDEEISDSNEQ
ncbi:MAG: hypothetical protein MRZ81_06180 [Peptoniphilaceae bacterium]|nr:hypothetical protein [Peptoniphilaceae bacterium]MDD7383582.1 hypothetical protein [Peptoniphilaceae bacterium]